MKKLKWKYLPKHNGYEADQKDKTSDGGIYIWRTNYIRNNEYILSMANVSRSFKKLSSAKKVAQIIHNG